MLFGISETNRRGWLPETIEVALRQIQAELFGTYRPEKHYMRGPGPKWRTKHGSDADHDQD